MSDKSKQREDEMSAAWLAAYEVKGALLEFNLELDFCVLLDRRMRDAFNVGYECGLKAEREEAGHDANDSD